MSQYVAECFRCGKVSGGGGVCPLCGSFAFHAPNTGGTAAYDLGGAVALDPLICSYLRSAGLSVRVRVGGSVVSYVWDGERDGLGVVVGEVERGRVSARAIETVGDVVRLALADWHTNGGKLGLPSRVGAYSVDIVGRWFA